MGRKSKLRRFAEVATFSNVYEIDPAQESFISNQEGLSRDLRGQWADVHFHNDHPVILELACGKGDYTVALARDHAEKNYIGVDIKGARMWRGARTALETGLNNVAFLRTRIEFIDRFFAPGEVSEIWITFPDPQLRVSRAKKRLTHPKFLRLYQQVLQPGGLIHLKTDSPNLYQFTRQVADMYGLKTHTDYEDVYAINELTPELKIKTHYEELDIAESNRVHYLCISLPEVLPDSSKDPELKEQLKLNDEEVI